MNEIEAYIRQSAAQHGIDPDVAVRVAMSEGGLHDPVRQSDYAKGGHREPSFGPFQLLIGGPGTGFGGGLGNRALAAGIDPRDPKQWQKGVDYALAEAGKRGWGQWYGAAKAGIGNYAGIGEHPTSGIPEDMVWDDKGMYRAGHPPGSDAFAGAEATGKGALPAAGNDANFYAALAAAGKDKKPTTGDILGGAVAGLGGGGGGNVRANVPQMPTQAGYSALPNMPTIDPQQAMAQRNELAMALQRLNSGRLWG